MQYVFVPGVSETSDGNMVKPTSDRKGHQCNRLRLEPGIWCRYLFVGGNVPERWCHEWTHWLLGSFGVMCTISPGCIRKNLREDSLMRFFAWISEAFPVQAMKLSDRSLSDCLNTSKTPTYHQKLVHLCGYISHLYHNRPT